MSFPNSSYSDTPPKSSFTSPFSGTDGKPDTHDGQGNQRHQARLQNRASNAALLGYEDEEDDAYFLPAFEAQLVDALLYQLNALKPPLANKLHDLVHLFATIKGEDKIFKALLRDYSENDKVQAMQQRLTQLTHHLLKALQAEGKSGKLDIQSFQQTDIQTLCQGLSLCVPVSGPGLFTKTKSNCQLLQALTSALLERAMQLGLPEGVAENGQVLDILNWVSHGIKAKLLHGDDTITKVFTRSLVLLESWSEGDHSRQLISDHNVGKCAVQIQVMYNEKLVDLDWKNTEGEGLDNLNRLKQCVLNFCTPETLHHLIKSSDTVSLLNICNTVKDFIKGGLLTKADAGLLPALRELVTFIGKLSDAELIGRNGDCQTLSNFSNFLRTLAEQKSNQQPLFTSELPQFDTTCARLVACINAKAFKEAAPGSQALSNLVSFIKLCGKRLDPNSAASAQKPLNDAAACLTEGVMAFGPDAYTEPHAMAGLLAGLAYLWESNLIVRSETVEEFIQKLVAQGGNLFAPDWKDKSRKIVLPHLQMLLKEKVLTLEQVQPALRHILGVQSEVTLATLIASSKRLGVITEVVVPLPLLTKTPEKKTTAPVADKPAEKVIPGQTQLRAENAGTTMVSTNSPLAIPASSSTTYRAPVQEEPRKPASKAPEIQTSPADTYHSEPVVSVRPTVVMPSQQLPQPKASVTTPELPKSEILPTKKNSPSVKNGQPKNGPSAQPVQARKKQTPATSSINSKKSVVTEGKSGRHRKMLTAIKQGKPGAVEQIMTNQGKWSDTEIRTLLEAVFFGQNFISKKFITAFDVFINAIIEMRGPAVIPVLRNYFEKNPPEFDEISKKLIARQIIKEIIQEPDQEKKSEPDQQAIANTEINEEVPKVASGGIETNVGYLSKIRNFASDQAKVISPSNLMGFANTLYQGSVDIAYSYLLIPIIESLKPKDSVGRNELMNACINGQIDIVSLLTAQGSINYQAKALDKGKWNALLHAISVSDRKIASLLLKLTSADDQARVVNTDGWNPLMYAIAKGLTDIASVLLTLDSKNVQANVRTKMGSNALIIAIDQGHTDIAAALLKLTTADEQAKASNNEGWNPLMYALVKGHTALAASLLTFPSASQQAEVINKHGWNALMCAIDHGHTAIAISLLTLPSAKVQAKAITNAGRNTLMLAESKGNTAVIAAIRALDSLH